MNNLKAYGQYAICMGWCLILLCIPFALMAQSLDEKVETIEASFKQQRIEWEDLRLEKIQRDLKKNGLPKRSSREKIVWHPGYYYSYSETHEQPKWVAHMIMPEITEFAIPRVDRFLQDSTLKDLSSSNAPYAGQKSKKYDRGHMAPAADFQWSEKAIDASFYFSNISPQRSSLNQKFWRNLEVFVRNYVRYYQSPLYVVTGPVLKSGLDKLESKDGTEKVSIPEEYFKVLLDLKRKRAIGFLVPQTASSRSKPSKYAMSIDDVEKESKVDFFASFRAKTEDALEEQLNYEVWDLSRNPAPATPVPLTDKDHDQGIYNTLEALDHVGEKIKVVGKVISVTQSDQGLIRLALDKNYSSGKTTSITVPGIPWSRRATWPFREFRAMYVIVEGTITRGAYGKVNLEIERIDDIKLWTK